jgi:hypothetical protein
MTDSIEGGWVNRGSSLVIGRVGKPLKDYPNIFEIYKTLVSKRAIFAVINVDNDNGNSYRCVFDNPDFDVESVKSTNARKSLRRGLSRNVIKILESDYLLEHGFKVYSSAVTRFSNYKPMTEGEFKNKISLDSQREGFRAYGAFSDDCLSAFMIVIEMDEIVFGDVAYFDPMYKNSYPMWGLYFTVARDSVSERKFAEFDRGSKPLVHETNIDDFLLKIGFTLKPCDTVAIGIFPFSSILLLLDLIVKKLPYFKHKNFQNKVSALARLIREK